MTKTRLLRVTSGYMCAGAVWTQAEDGTWTCTQAAPILAWMVAHRHPPSKVRQILRRLRMTYEWLDDPAPPRGGGDRCQTGQA